MESVSGESTRKRMESMRLACDREIQNDLQKLESFTASFYRSLDLIKARAEEAAENQVKVAKMRSRLAEAEHEFVKVLAVKTRKEAKQMATRDSISAIRARIEEHKKSIKVLKARRDEYATIMSLKSQGLDLSEEKGKEDVSEGEIQEAVLWYNKFLGFRVEGGRGVKFTFNNINAKNPLEEYSFTIRHEHNAYTLLACCLHIKDTEELIHELNKTNGLFKFVRTMREKFQEAASLGTLPQSTALDQESCMVSISAPSMSVTTDGSESTVKAINHPHQEVYRKSKRRGPKQAISSPASVRRSPRFLVIHPNNCVIDQYDSFMCESLNDVASSKISIFQLKSKVVREAKMRKKGFELM